MTRHEFLDKMYTKNKIDQKRYDAGLAKLKDRETLVAKDKTKLTKAELIAMVEDLTK